MKCIPAVFLTALVVLSLRGTSMAGYSAYVNISADANNIIYSSAVVDGSYYAMPLGAMHTPEVYNNLNGVGGWVYGTSAPPQNYISATNNQQIQGVPGAVYSNNTTEQVYCTVGGLVYVAPINISVSIKVATYGFVSTDPQTGYSTYVLNCPNGNGHCTCGTANYLGSQAHKWAEEFTLWTSARGCFFVNLVQYKDGPPAPYNCS
jgi:hypothetical protein